MKEREKFKKKIAITDLNALNGSRDIPLQSQEFEQDGCRHFWILASFSLKYDVIDAMMMIFDLSFPLRNHRFDR